MPPNRLRRKRGIRRILAKANRLPYTKSLASQPNRLPIANVIAIGVTLAVLALLLFSRLNHYALWDDESVTALDAKGIMKTGDASVLMEHGNIIGYRNGTAVQNFVDRVDPPLQNYLTAASFSVLGLQPWEARLPFAIFGFGAVALVLWGARKEKLTLLIMLGIGLCGNVSLILFSRQCRYYALSIFFTTALIYVYWRWKPTPRTFLTVAGISVLLFAANYLTYLAVYLCLAVDWIFWQRKKWVFNWSMALLVMGPQIVVNGVVGFLWNPLRTNYGGSIYLNSFWDRLTLLLWYWRDLNECEFFALPLIVLALVLGIYLKRPWLVRGCVALAVFLAGIAMISPQSIHITSVADIRYMVPIIPLAIVLEVGALWILLQGSSPLAIAAAVIVFGSNLCNGGPLLPEQLRSTILSYACELFDPPPDPYTLTSDWINANVPDDASIWTVPDYTAYPLMFRAPRALYAWQLDWPPRSDFANMPKIHFKGQEPPDYLIAFGPALGQMAQALQSWGRPDVKYTQVATIDIFWKDLYRPELFWRTFSQVKGYDPKSQAIYIFKRTAPPVSK